jgi:hypothetical protein
MKKYYNTSPVFDKALKTIDFTVIPNFNIKQLIAVINQTSGTIIYATGNPNLGYTTLSGNTVTLVCDTSSQNNADVLQVIYDDQSVQTVALTAGVQVNGTTGLSAINVDLLTNIVNGWYDAALFQSGAIQIIATVGISAGAIIFEQTNDNTNSTGTPLQNQEVSSINLNPNIAAFSITASTSRIFKVAINARYIRVRISTAFVGGTVRAFSFFSEFPYSAPILNVQQAVAANLNVNAVIPSLLAGANLIGDVAQQYRANATGAASRLHLISAATTNNTTVKASSGRLLGFCISNTNAAYRYVKLHNIATAPVAGVGVVQTIAVPPNNNVTFTLEGGVAFTVGIGLTTTTGSPDADNVAVSVGDLIIDLFFV